MSIAVRSTTVSQFQGFRFRALEALKGDSGQAGFFCFVFQFSVSNGWLQCSDVRVADNKMMR